MNQNGGHDHDSACLSDNKMNNMLVQGSNIELDTNDNQADENSQKGPKNADQVSLHTAGSEIDSTTNNTQKQ